MPRPWDHHRARLVPLVPLSALGAGTTSRAQLSTIGRSRVWAPLRGLETATGAFSLFEWAEEELLIGARASVARANYKRTHLKPASASWSWRAFFSGRSFREDRRCKKDFAVQFCFVNKEKLWILSTEEERVGSWQGGFSINIFFLVVSYTRYFRVSIF